MKIYFAHCKFTNNIGDLRCCPYYYYESYFKQFDCEIIDLSEIQQKQINKDDFIIIGGGGILNWSQFWNNCICLGLNKTKNIIIWGCGYNMLTKEIDFKPIDLSAMLLVGIRDYYHPYYNFVPCVSCKSKFFDQKFEIKRQVGVIKHFTQPYQLKQFKNFQVIKNDIWIYDVIKFIGQSQIILSDSYHALYWASLLGKKVGRLNIYNSSRFNDCFYQYPSVFNQQDILKCSKMFLTDSDLSYFRLCNDLFFNKVKRLVQK